MHPLVNGVSTPYSRMEWPEDNELLDSTETGLLYFVSAFFRRSLQQLFDVHSGPDLRLEVNDWVYATPIVFPETDAEPLSFQHCCQVLGLDPLEVRELVQGYLVRTRIIDHMDNCTMAVRDKSRPVDVNTDDLPDFVQLLIFAEDDADFVPPPLPKRRIYHSRSLREGNDSSNDFGTQLSMFDAVEGLCA